MTKLKETFSCEGKWWLPGDTGDPLLGTLHYHYQEGLKLELKGIFKPFIKKDPRTSNSPVILGESDDGEKITLYGCVRGVKTPSSHMREHKSPSFSAFNCLIAFTGHHFYSTEELKFKKIFVNFSHLDEWLGIPCFTVTHSYDEEKETPKIQIEYIQPKPIAIRLDEIFSITIDFFYELPTGDYNQSEATIKQSITVCIESVDERKISDFFDIIKQLERFFSLGIMKPACAFNFRGILNDGSEEKYPTPIKIFMELDENIDLRNKIDPHVMLFTYDDIQDKIELLLQNWFNKCESLQPVFDLYFTTVNHRDMPIYLEFLSYIQAIETFHIRIKNNKSKQEIKQRLIEIFKDYYKIIFFFNIKKDKFIQDVTNTRHFLTHYNPNLKEKALKGAGLDEATRKLRAILQFILLLELGFDGDGINRFAGKIERWQLDTHYTTFKI